MTPQREIEQQRQLLWLLVSRLGGEVDVAWAEMANVPAFPPLTIQTTGTGFTIRTPA